ncbi:GNAT family N-acetyltransferase [Streptomyces sp. CHD11]|uniref:GNAT family N-acetyltransferase n=1 Tax=Streptomyces sp. CHD11 TaxID=2741325 RepID=UPI001BFC88C2|nr:GNAT family N-acetyltransferase [Streptomyces sp. CHD11]MBT3153709.1 GNAT family N-acetyltransferase [Streptomyces sp. CHD11]
MDTENSATAVRKPHVRVRPRADHDLDSCARVLAEVHRCDGYPVNWPDRPGEWVSPGAAPGVWVAELDGRVVGHAVLSRGGEGDVAPGLWSARSGAGRDLTAVVSRLFVGPRARGHGIGALLIGRAADEARGRGLHPVLDVVASDTGAVALYERLGRERMATVEQRWSPSRSVVVHCYAAAP